MGVKQGRLHVQIAQRAGVDHLIWQRQTKCFEVGLGAGMHREVHRSLMLVRPSRHGAQSGGQLLLVIHESGAMQRAHQHRPFAGPSRWKAVRQSRLGGQSHIQHDVSGLDDARLGMSLRDQLFGRTWTRRDPRIRQGIGQDAVELFRHGPVSTPQPRFDMNQGHSSMVGRQCTGQGGVGVPVHDHDGRSRRFDFLGDAGHHVRHANRSTGLAGTEPHIRRRHPQLRQEVTPHVIVGMLTRMQKALRPRPTGQCPGEGRRLDELRSGSHDGQDEGGICQGIRGVDGPQS